MNMDEVVEAQTYLRARGMTWTYMETDDKGAPILEMSNTERNLSLYDPPEAGDEKIEEDKEIDSWIDATLAQTQYQPEQAEQYEQSATHINWEFRKILSYWSAVFYIIGSVMFIVGCSFAYSNSHNVYDPKAKYANQKGFVDYPFTVGACCYLAGGYLGWFRHINKNFNLKGKTSKSKIYFFVSYSALKDRYYLKSFFYMAGSCFYVFEHISSIIQGESIKATYTSYFFQIILFVCIASALQFVASILDMIVCLEEEKKSNKEQPGAGHCWFMRLDNLALWACYGNVIATFLFAVGSWALLFTTTNMYWTNLPFLIGSIIFVLTSWIYLYAWKAEQYMYYYKVKKGKVSLIQQVMLAYYITALTFAVAVLVFCLYRRREQDLYFSLFAFAAIFVDIGCIQGANVVFKSPKSITWRSLLIWTRWGAFFVNFPLLLVAIDSFSPCLIGGCRF